jgi:formylmethanofuran dehydrogenase subunit E
MTVNRDTWISQIKKDYPNVPDYVVNWMLDVYEKDPEFFKKESKKKHKVKPKEDIPPPEHFELKTVQVKFAEKQKPPVKVDGGGYINVDFS